jgi:hypothetical protein
LPALGSLVSVDAFLMGVRWYFTAVSLMISGGHFIGEKTEAQTDFITYL